MFDEVKRKTSRYVQCGMSIFVFFNEKSLNETGKDHTFPKSSFSEAKEITNFGTSIQTVSTFMK